MRKAKFAPVKAAIYQYKQPEDHVFHLDQSGFAFGGTPKKCLSRKGHQPILPSPGGRQHVNVIGVVDPFTGWSFFQYVKRFNAVVFMVFLACLIAQFPGPGVIYLFLDNSPVHHAKLLRTFLAAHADKLRLVFLPPRSPEFNEEIEGIWREVKRAVVYNGWYRTFTEFYARLDREFDMYRRHPEVVRTHCNATKFLATPAVAAEA